MLKNRNPYGIRAQSVDFAADKPELCEQGKATAGREFLRKTADYTLFHYESILDIMESWHTCPITEFVQNYKYDWKKVCFEGNTKVLFQIIHCNQNECDLWDTLKSVE
jgi:hypothetical protein